MEREKDILNKLNIEEKASLLSQITWETTDISGFRLQGFLLADGPSGLRRMKEYFDEDIYNTYPTTCYPSASTYACSWDRDLLKNIGKHLGVEAQKEQVDVLLGPGVNLKRSPLGGRNFEYYSEDPYVTSELATEYILGIQEEGVGACIKHFAVNNQESNRMSVNAVVSEKALYELYLKAFEKPVKVGKPYMVMTAYNKVNGFYCAHHKQLLSEILRGKWMFDGVVITDCYAAHDLREGIKNGLNMQMPGESKERLAKQIGSIMEDEPEFINQLNKAVLRNIVLSEKCWKNDRRIAYDREEHHAFAEKVAVESMVLLKNEETILPFNENEQIAVIGEMAEIPRFQGGGSSHVNPYRLVSVTQALKTAKHSVMFAKGYDEESTTKVLEEEAVALAGKAQKVLFCMGLPEYYESEGYDRTHLRLPDVQENLLDKIAQVNDNIVVVLFHGAPVLMPWISKVKGVLAAYLPGEALGSAVVKLLYGEENPSGKLAETFPLRLQDTPAFLNFPGSRRTVNYREDVYIGYRYYDKTDGEVLFPFGYGLSYTSFGYSDLRVSKEILAEGESMEVFFRITNTGNRQGKEVTQLYIKTTHPHPKRVIRELKNFTKTSLNPGKTKEISMTIHADDFKYYDDEMHDWVLEKDDFVIQIGSSSHEILLEKQIHILPSQSKVLPVSGDTSLGELMEQEKRSTFLKDYFRNCKKTMEFITYCEEKNPLTESMGSLMSFQNLKRVDPMLTDEMIEQAVSALNRIME